MIGALIGRKAVAGAFDALNRHDLPRFMSAWRDDAVFIYPGEIAQSGIFRGKSVVEIWFQRFFEQFPRINFSIQDLCVRNIFDVTGTNAVAAHWNLDVTNREGRTGQYSGVTVVSISRGKVVLVKDFLFDTGENFKRLWSAA